jgi:hypothetical protein
MHRQGRPKFVALGLVVVALGVLLQVASSAQTPSPIPEVKCAADDPRVTVLTEYARGRDEGGATPEAALDYYLLVNGYDLVIQQFKPTASTAGGAAGAMTTETLAIPADDGSAMAVATAEQDAYGHWFVVQFTTCYSYEQSHLAKG